MKNLKYFSGIGFMALALAMPSCEKVDNSAELLAGLDGLNERVTALETLQSQIDALKGLVDASKNNFLITSVEEIKEDEVIIGYKITFSNNQTITINNGNVWSDGTTPIITVAEHTDGKLYWKVNGQWLMNGENMVSAEGPLPQFRIQNKIWEVSFDGQIWNPVTGGEITGESTVTVEDKVDYYIFNIDGQLIEIQKYKPLQITFNETYTGNAIIEVDSDTSINIYYSVSGLAAGVDPLIMTFADGQYTVTVDEDQKKITVSHNTSLVGAEITVLVSDGNQRTIARKIRLVAQGTVIPEIILPEITDSELQVAASGCTQTVSVSSNLEANKITASISDGDNWVTIASDSNIKQSVTRTVTMTHNLILSILENTSETERTATVTLNATEGGESKIVSFDIVQAGKQVVSDEAEFNFTGTGVDGDDYTTSSLKAAMEADGNINGNISNIVKLKITGNSLGSADQKYLNELSKSGSLRELDLSESSTTEIVNSAFEKSILTSIKLPNSITKIGEFAFKESTLTSIELPSTTTIIGSNAFKYSKITNIVLSENITEIGSSAFENTPLTSIVIPGKVSKIYNGTFQNCTALKNIIIKGKTDFVQSNGDYSNYVFKNCTSLESITIEYEGLLILVSNSNFGNVPKSSVLYVPSGLVETYKGDTEGWARTFTGERIKAIGSE